MVLKSYDWAVVGAGPAGIAAIGKLIDNGVSPASILWVDPYFSVGDLGRLWGNVSSNTTVGLFHEFLSGSVAFDYQSIREAYSLATMSDDLTCELHEVVKPLQSITDKLRQQVHSILSMVYHLELKFRRWYLSTENGIYAAKQVILATGSVPSVLDIPDKPILPLEQAIDKDKLERILNPDHTYAVFGSSHSAMIILRLLVELGAKKVINFYRSPNQYALNMGDWILFDNTGLKGETALWARAHIDGDLPDNLERYIVNEENIAKYIPVCDQLIYAVGFERRHSLKMDGEFIQEYNPHVGIIAPGLFGFGIGYPEKKIDPFGNTAFQVGLWKFMAYLNKVMPIWMNYTA